MDEDDAICERSLLKLLFYYRGHDTRLLNYRKKKNIIKIHQYQPKIIDPPFDPFPKSPTIARINGAKTEGSTSIPLALSRLIVDRSMKLRCSVKLLLHGGEFTSLSHPLSPPHHFIPNIFSLHITFKLQKNHQIPKKIKSWFSRILDSSRMTLVRLKSDFDWVKSKFNPVMSDFDRVKSDLDWLKSNFNPAKSNFDRVKSDFHRLKSDINRVKSGFYLVKADFAWVKSDFDRVKSDFDSLEPDFDWIKSNFDWVRLDFYRVKIDFVWVTLVFDRVKSDFHRGKLDSDRVKPEFNIWHNSN